MADPGQPTHWGVDFWIDEIDVAARHAAELGGVVLLPPQKSGVFRFRSKSSDTRKLLHLAAL